MTVYFRNERHIRCISLRCVFHLTLLSGFVNPLNNCWWAPTAHCGVFSLYFFFNLPSLKAELPPPYTAIASPDASGVPVINCRVCQSLINLDGKLHQHVVKCTVCNEATVRESHCFINELRKASSPFFF